MASHIGRVWEYQIKTACNVLNVLLDQAGTQLDEKSLNTFMCETEAIVNSCLLTVNNISSPTEPDLNHKYYCHLQENPREPTCTLLRDGDLFSITSISSALAGGKNFSTCYSKDKSGTNPKETCKQCHCVDKRRQRPLEFLAEGLHRRSVYGDDGLV